MMRYVTVIFFLLVLTQCTPSRAWNGSVVRVVDGDSLLIKRDKKVYEIRLYGIDAPEYDQDYSNGAQQEVIRLTAGQTVSVEPKGIGIYGRVIALVTSQGRLVNRELVRDGLAWYYPRYCLEQPLCRELKTLEKKARLARLGLWRADDPISPWVWKHRRKPSASQERFRRRHGRFSYRRR
ncbi:MAG TPA: thermonuclease family protein [Desulfobacteraceae bacterium]|nr:thermonuclease precursor [bacterium BMS3Abin13]HDL98000.1 thermonuclease family protein [Desulfobacteraceae bacterium]HDO29769.1 thermonuclease family protein [Desulfobacteraceae bacterium]HDZ75953.1 thermonuclease family protein [Desulfobacteraceae bacterium]